MRTRNFGSVSSGTGEENVLPFFRRWEKSMDQSHLRWREIWKFSRAWKKIHSRTWAKKVFISRAHIFFITIRLLSTLSLWWKKCTRWHLKDFLWKKTYLQQKITNFGLDCFRIIFFKSLLEFTGSDFGF